MPLETGVEAWAAISLIAAITFASRLAGSALMHFVRITPGLERFLETLSVTVIAALVASIIAQGNLRSAVAAGFAAIIMLALKSAVWAMVAGMGIAAVWSWIALP